MKERLRALGALSRKKKILLILGVVSLLALLFLLPKLLFHGGDEVEGGLDPSQVKTLAKEDITEVVNEAGVVVTENTVPIYTEKPLPVESVKVKLGDYVNEGDVIAILDATEIRQQIAQKEAAMSQSAATSGAAIRDAKMRLDQAKKALADGTNASIRGADSGVLSAYDAWKTAEKTYADYKRSIDEGYNDSVRGEETAKETAKDQSKTQAINYEAALRKYNETRESITRNQNLALAKGQEAADLERLVYSLEDSIRKDTQRLEELKAQNAPAPSDAPSAPTTSAADIDLKIGGLNEKIQNIDAQIGSLKLNPQGADNTKKLVEDLERQKNQFQLQIRDLEAQKRALPPEQPSTPAPTVDLTADIEALETKIAEDQRTLAKAQERQGQAKGEAETAKSEAEAAVKGLPDMEDQLAQLQIQNDAQRRSVIDTEKSALASARTRESTLEGYKRQADAAKRAYEDAKKSLTIAKTDAKNEIKSLENSYKSAAAGNSTVTDKMDLQNLSKDLEATIIKAPISGTITQLPIKEGQKASSSIATIQTTDELQIRSKVKEFDYNKLEVGMKVTIQSDAVKGETYTGKVLSIAQTTTMGTETATGKDGGTQGIAQVSSGGGNSQAADYPVTIALDNPQGTKLAPDMNVKIKYIIREERGVYTVPDGAVLRMGEKTYLRILDGKGPYTVKEIPVTVRPGNAINVIVSGAGIRDNVKVLTAADAAQPGDQVNLVTNPDAPIDPDAPVDTSDGGKDTGNVDAQRPVSEGGTPSDDLGTDVPVDEGASS